MSLVEHISPYIEQIKAKKTSSRPRFPFSDKEQLTVLSEQMYCDKEQLTARSLPACDRGCISDASGRHYKSEVNEGYRVARVCPCGRANQMLAAVKALRLPVEAKNNSLENYDFSREPGLREITAEMLSAINDGERKVMILLGAPGCGKTHLLHGLALSAALLHARRVTYVQQHDYILSLKAQMDGSAVELPSVSGSRALLLDELAIGTQTDWQKDQIGTMLHLAWSKGKSIIIASDQSKETLGFGSRRGFLEPRIVDRLRGGSDNFRLAHEFQSGSRR